MDLKLTQHLKLDSRMRCSVDEMTLFTSCQLRPAAELTTELRASEASEALSNSSRFLLSLLSNLKLHRALRRHPTLYTSFCAHAGALFKHNFDVKFLSNTKSERLIWMSDAACQRIFKYMHPPRVRDLCVEQNMMATVSAGLNLEPGLQRQTGS